MILHYLLILQAISSFYCYDLELEGVMKVGKDFLRTLKQRSEFAKKLNLPLNFKSKGKLPKKALGSAVMRAITEKQTTESNTPSDRLQEFIRHLQKKGNKTLHKIGKQIVNDLKIDMNITFLLNTVTTDYVTTMQNYYDFVSKEHTNSSIDRDFVYLDIVETSNRLLYSEERKLLNDIILDQNLTADNSSVEAMNEKIFKQNVHEKKDKMKYICKKYNVCREYPAFTDYCADLISEILKLTDKKFTTILELLKKILKHNHDFFATVSEKEDREVMTEKLHSFTTDLFAMKEFFAVLRAVITQRFKAVLSNNDNLKMRTKAMRILLDIIDKALSRDEDILAIDFDNSVSALRSWAGGVREDINDIFEDFAKNLLRILEFNLTKGARKEIRILIKTIMRGTTEDDKSVEELFSYGSKYVKGEDFHPLIDNLN